MKLNWLDKFAEDQSKKMQKQASLNKVAEQIIVNPDEVPDAIDGQEVLYNNESYKVVNANFSDEIGSGVVLEKISKVTEAELDGEVLPAEMSMEMSTDVAPTTPAGQKKVTDAPEKAVQPDQGNAGLHIEVRDTVEVDKFNEEAIETENQIAQENAIDRTVPEGKYNRILQRMQSMPVVEETVVEEAPVEEVAVEETPVEEVPVEEVVEETPVVEEAPVEEVPAEEAPVEEAPAEDESKKQVTSNRILARIINGK